MSIRLSNGTEIPIEMHKVRIVQKTRLAPARERLKAIEAAGYWSGKIWGRINRSGRKEAVG